MPVRFSTRCPNTDYLGFEWDASLRQEAKDSVRNGGGRWYGRGRRFERRQDRVERIEAQRIGNAVVLEREQDELGYARNVAPAETAAEPRQGT